MDPEETKVYNYLSLNPDTIVFEPNGYKTFPDFRLKENIALEVTKLTQKLEGKSIALTRNVKNVLRKYNYQNSYYVSIQITQPIFNDKKILKNIKVTVEKFEGQGSVVPFQYGISKFARINFQKKRKAGNEKYYLQSLPTDLNKSHSFEDYNIKAINNRIVSKEKIKNESNNKFNEYWLYLVDNIHSLEDTDKTKIRSHINKLSWNKIVILDSTGSKILLDI